MQYNFQPRFVEAIELGDKTFTIRTPRKDDREPKVNDPLYLFTGLRTKHAKRIIAAGSVEARKGPAVLCKGVFRLYMNNDGFLLGSLLFEHKTQFALVEAFSRLDGFSSWIELCKFHRFGRSSHSKFLISWGASTIDELLKLMKEDAARF